MAAKFKRSIQTAGFRPEQVSERNVSQLQEYSNRIINALKDERDAVITNRNEISSAMKENAQIENNQAQLNQKIQEQNLNTQLKAQQDLSAQSFKEFETKTLETQKLYGTFADLSLTASKKLREIEVEKIEQKDKAQAAEILMMGDNHPAVKALKALKHDAQIEELNAKVKVAQAREQGADPISADEALKQLNALGYHAKTAILTNVGKQWRGYLTEALISEDKKYINPKTGERFSGLEASGNQYLAQIVASQELEQFEKVNGIAGQLAALKQESGYYDSIFNTTQSFLNVASQTQHANFKQEELQSFRFKLKNAKNAAEAQRIVELEFPTLRSLFGNEEAHNILQETGSEVDIDGQPVYNLAGIQAAKLGPKGEAWGEYWEQRAIKARRAQVQGFNAATTAAESNKMAKSIQDFNRIRPGLLEQLAAASPRDDLSILDTAEKQLFDRNGGFVPKSFSDLKAQILKENKTESKNKAAMVEEKIRNGTATQGDVLSIADPEMRANTQKLYIEATKTRKFGENYKETFKAIKSAAKTIMGDSLEGAASFEAERLNLVMQKNFSIDYEEGLRKFNNDPARALQYASDRLERDVQAAKVNTDKTARYYSETGPGNSKVFKNIRGFEAQTNAEKDQAMNTLISTVGAVGIGALDSPGLLGSELEMRKLSEANRTGEVLKFTPQVLKAAKLLGITELEAANAAIAAFNKNGAGIPPLMLDPSLQLINDARPETRALFFDNPSVSSVMRGSAEILQEPLRNPSNIRANIVQYVTGQPSMRSVVRGADGKAVIYDPVGHGGRDYHNHYQFSSVPERERVEAILRTTIDPWTGQPYNITSTTKGLDGKTPREGTHGLGLSMDVAPPETLPPDQEEAWSAHLNKVLGYDPLRAN